VRIATALIVLTLLTGPVAGQGVTRDEALASAYPGATITAERVFLTVAQRAKAAELAGVEVESSLVARYLATRDGQVVGRAYIDTHQVRTKRESLLIALDVDGRVRRVEVTAFLEPPEYRAPAAWLRQFGSKELGDDLAVDRAIRPLAGATFTSRATTLAVRRVLAIDTVLTEGSRR